MGPFLIDTVTVPYEVKDPRILSRNKVEVSRRDVVRRRDRARKMIPTPRSLFILGHGQEFLKYQRTPTIRPFVYLVPYYNL